MGHCGIGGSLQNVAIDSVLAIVTVTSIRTCWNNVRTSSNDMFWDIFRRSSLLQRNYHGWTGPWPRDTNIICTVGVMLSFLYLHCSRRYGLTSICLVIDTCTLVDGVRYIIIKVKRSMVILWRSFACECYSTRIRITGQIAPSTLVACIADGVGNWRCIVLHVCGKKATCLWQTATVGYR